MEGGAVMSNQEKDIWMYIVIILFFGCVLGTCMTNRNLNNVVSELEEISYELRMLRYK